MKTYSFNSFLVEWIKNKANINLRDNIKEKIDLLTLPSYKDIKKLMDNYTFENLKNTDDKNFKKKIKYFLTLKDYKNEGFKDPSKQRDLSIKFHWGHNHDFGGYKLRGMMGNSHITVISTFLDKFNISKSYFKNKKILDIGCWTGGTSLLLSSLDGKVTAIEEVKKYVDTVNYLISAFGIKNINAKYISLYDCTSKDYENKFDIVLFSGVIYHITDPILALRICFNALKKNGTCMVESATANSNKKILIYNGPSVINNGKKSKLNRSGWNWYVPSPSALEQMMKDVGFTNVIVKKASGNRVFAMGTKKSQKDMLRAGLSVKNIT